MEVSLVSLDHVTLGNSYESRSLNGASQKSLSLDPGGYRDEELVIIFRSREQSEL